MKIGLMPGNKSVFWINLHFIKNWDILSRFQHTVDSISRTWGNQFKQYSRKQNARYGIV